MSSKKGDVLSPFQHAYHRPDTYVGSVATTLTQKWVWNPDNSRAEYKKIPYNPGLFSILREIGSNIIDNKWRSEKDPSSPSMSKIVIKTDLESGLISFWNDGYTIPVHKETYTFNPFKKDSYELELYPAEVFFGQMGAGTNFDDTQERKTSGRNGMGAKLTNIFSKEFTVEHTCPEDGKKFVQKHWSNGLECSKPKITKYSRPTGYTKISFIPDYKYFNYPSEEPGLDENLVNLLKVYAYEIAMLTGIPVTFNGRKLNIKTLEDYARLFYPDKSKYHMARFQSSTGDECVILEGDPPEDDTVDKVNHKSFVNGIQTTVGGIHVDEWEKKIITPFVTFFNNRKPKKGEKTALKVQGKEVKPYLTFFIRAEIDKPQFATQTKEQLTGPCDSNGKSLYKVSNTKEFRASREAAFKKMMRWNFVVLLEDKLAAKADRALKREEGISRRVTGPGFDDANKAGSAESSSCILCITEGMSAKGFMDSAIGSYRGSGKKTKNGTDYWGSLAIRGKFLNVRNAGSSQVNNNKEIKQLKKVLGLRYGTDYSIEKNFKTLRYGGVWIVTDADDDGIHIRALLLNFFHHFFPSLIERDYVHAFNTAVVKVASGGKRKKIVGLFYSVADFHRWLKDHKTRGCQVSYYKGLGSIPKPEAPVYFKDPKIVTYFFENGDDEYMTLGFDRDAADQRKKWICRNMEKDSKLYKWYLSVTKKTAEAVAETVEEQDFLYEGRLSIGCFVDHQLITYHKMTLRRHLPCIWDGFTEGQRKAFYAIRKAKLKHPQNLERIGGLAKTETAYHHGSDSLQKTIIRMAQGFVGRNNIPLLVPEGNFGSRNAGGKDHAKPRYPSTMLEDIVSAIFPEEDDPLLVQLEDTDGPIEYSTFFPVIPMILVNGGEGPACGFSTEVPCYNPEDLVEWLEARLESAEEAQKLPPLKPWYKGFIGEIDFIDGTPNPVGWTSKGILEKDKKDKNWWHIRELPIGVWPCDFKNHLEYLETGSPPEGSKRKKKLEVKCISEFRNYNTSNTVHYMIKPTRDFIPDTSVSGNMDILVKKHSLRNMVVIDEKNYPYRFSTPEQILECFYRKRLEYYSMRKDYLLNLWEIQLRKVTNKYRFVKAVGIDRKLDLHGFDSDEDLYQCMENEYGFDKLEDSFDYLLSMQVRSLTRKKAEALAKEKGEFREKIKILKTKTDKDLWKEDLAKFQEAYKKFLKSREE